MYRIEFLHKARQQLDKIFGGRDAESICVAILSLGDTPRPPGGRKIKRNIYRIPVGDWRVIFSIDDKLKQIAVGKIARRSENTYDDVEDLF